MHSIHWIIINYLITESEALPYWPSNSEVNTVGQDFEIFPEQPNGQGYWSFLL